MSAGLYGSVGGVNRKIKKLYANVGGVNREVKELWAVKDGVNRKIHSGSDWTFELRSLGLSTDYSVLNNPSTGITTFKLTPKSGASNEQARDLNAWFILHSASPITLPQTPHGTQYSKIPVQLDLAVSGEQPAYTSGSFYLYSAEGTNFYYFNQPQNDVLLMSGGIPSSYTSDTFQIQISAHSELKDTPVNFVYCYNITLNGQMIKNIELE